MTSPNAGWHPDPAGVHELRYFDGSAWTDHISTAGVTGLHTLPAQAAQAAPAPAPAAQAAAPVVRSLEAEAVPVAATAQAPRQYKVLTQKDRFFAGKFDPLKLEGAINSYAQQGWRVVSMATASIPGLGNAREELIVLLERG
jgi:hypothetical protein